MEAVVRIVTQTEKGAPAPPVRHWRHLDGMNCIGRYVPVPKARTPEEQQKAEDTREYTRNTLDVVDIEINIQLGTFTLNTAKIEHLDEKVMQTADFKEVFGETTAMACASVKNTTKRNWVRLVGLRYDLHMWKADERVPTLSWFSRRYSPENLGGSETWISRVLEPIRKTHRLIGTSELFLPAATYGDKDVIARLVGQDEIIADIAAVEARKGGETARAKDDNCYQCNLKFGLTNRHHCRHCGKSVCANCSSKVQGIPGYTDDKNNSKDSVRLCEPCKLILTPRKSLKELVVFRRPPVVHLYRIQEHGRRFYRTLVFSSDWRISLHDMPPFKPFESTSLITERYAAGSGTPELADYMRHTPPEESLVITRNFGNTPQDLQTFVPGRLLTGLIPDALLNDFVFWQNADNSITGYQRPYVRERTQTAFALRMYPLFQLNTRLGIPRCTRMNHQRSEYYLTLRRYLTPSGAAEASARIIRKNLNDVKATGELSKVDLLAPTKMDKLLWEEEIKGTQSGKCEELTLLNIAYAIEGTFLSELAEYLIRIEDMSCIQFYQLSWSY